MVNRFERIIVIFCVPVYLYAEATDNEKRKKLPTIRAGEYEGLQEKVSIKLPPFKKGEYEGLKEKVSPLGRRIRIPYKW